MEKKNSSVDYLEIIKHSWQLTLKKRYLWWFGFFVALTGTSSGNYFNYSFPTNSNSGEPNWEDAQKALDFVTQNAQWFILGALILFVLCVIFVILGNLGRGALIASIDRENRGVTSGFKKGFSLGRKHFWRIFSISFSTGVFVLAAIVVLGIPVLVLFLNEHYFFGATMSGAGLLILAVLIVLVAYIRNYGYLYAVLGRLGFWDSIENAYSLFQKNMAKSIVLGLIFVPLNILFMIAVVALALAIALVFLGFGLALYLAFGGLGLAIVSALAILIFIAGIIFLKSVYEVFAQSIWVSFFYAIAKEEKEEIVAEKEAEPIDVAKAMPVIECERK